MSLQPFRRRDFLSLALLTFVAAAAVPVAARASAKATPPADQQPPLRLLVIGDSLAQGLASTLGVRARQLPAFVVMQEGVHSTGFTRYHQLDWAAKVTEILAKRKIDAVAMWMGLNDFRPMVDPDTRRRYDFATPEWAKLYADRVDTLIDILAKARIPLFWLGLPSLRDATNNRGMQVIDALQRERVQQHGETWISTAELTSAPDGTYQAFLPDPARGPRRLRADDGAHFTELGYRIVADQLLVRMMTRIPELKPVLGQE
ncbi:MAG: DUF459 domain-containing protein [Alphaproteobacteria bacterium]